MRWAAIAGCLSVLGTVAEAQIEAGDVRVGVGVLAYAYSQLEEEGVDIERNDFAIAPGGSVRVGYALTEAIELGGDLAVAYQDVDVQGSSSHGWSLAVGPYIAGNFPVNAARTAVLSPSLFLGYNHEDFGAADFDAFQFAVGGELKYFVAESASVDAGIFFSYLTGSGRGGGAHFDIDGWSIGPRLGISIWP